MFPWIFGARGLIMGDPGLKKIVLLSWNMPDSGTIVWFSGTCAEIFFEIFGATVYIQKRGYLSLFMKCLT